MATSYAVADAPLGPCREMGRMSEQRTWNSQVSYFVYIAESDKVFAMCDQWFRGPKGQRVPIDESCQLWLPVSFDPVTGEAKMLHVDEWAPSPRRSLLTQLLSGLPFSASPSRAAWASCSGVRVLRAQNQQKAMRAAAMVARRRWAGEFSQLMLRWLGFSL
jgi:hypothetical protein